MSAHQTDRPHVYAQRVVYHRAKALGSLRELARMAVETGQDPAPYRNAVDALEGRLVPPKKNPGAAASPWRGKAVPPRRQKGIQ